MQSIQKQNGSLSRLFWTKIRLTGLGRMRGETEHWPEPESHSGERQAEVLTKSSKRLIGQRPVADWAWPIRTGNPVSPKDKTIVTSDVGNYIFVVSGLKSGL